MQWSIRRASWIGLVAVSILVSTLAFLAYRYAADLSRTRAALDHTNDVSDTLQALMGALTDAETGQRGFLVTQDAAYLKPYHVALTTVPKQLRRIESLAADEAPLAATVAELTELVTSEMAELRRVLAIAEANGFAAAFDAVRSHIGRRLMRQIRDRIAAIQEELEASDRADRVRADAAERRTFEAVVVIVMVSLLVIGLTGWMMRAEIDERRRTAAELQHLKDTAEAALAAKATFVALLSHELRSPLTSVIGFAELLGGQSLGPLGHPRYVDYAARIQKGSEHLLDLINDVLDLAKADAGRFQLHEAEFSLAELIELCVALLEPQASRAGVALSWSVAAEAGQVRADPKRLKQIIANLVGNAIKYTPAGGAVRIAAERAGDGALVLAVSDTGIGIGADEIAKALEPFRQLDNRANRTFAGTGLGLPITRRLAELHGGSLALESAVGAGTTAIVRLPAERVREPAPRLAVQRARPAA